MAVVFIVIGTRPNFVKVTRFKAVAKQYFEDIQIKLIHTGQHYDTKMARVFFDQFGLQPDFFLELAATHPAQQVAAIIDQLSTLFMAEQPDMVMAVGDVNSTLAAAIAANKCNIPLAHLESGLRSFDNSMPEEHNRKITDLLSQLYFVTEDSGLQNLRHENGSDSGISFVGNTMIDTMCFFEPEIEASTVLEKLLITKKQFGLATIHRPSTADDRNQLCKLISMLRSLCKLSTVVLPLHPRTHRKLQDFDLFTEFSQIENLVVTEPMDYFDFQKLIKECSYVLTDSGGIQEETTFRKVPCLTLRPNTERPVTILKGTNQLIDFEEEEVVKLVKNILVGKGLKGSDIPLWDGKATYRVLSRLREYFETGC